MACAGAMCLARGLALAWGSTFQSYRIWNGSTMLQDTKVAGILLLRQWTDHNSLLRNNQKFMKAFDCAVDGRKYIFLTWFPLGVCSDFKIDKFKNNVF